jgi:hypothetical protein
MTDWPEAAGSPAAATCGQGAAQMRGQATRPGRTDSMGEESRQFVVTTPRALQATVKADWTPGSIRAGA